MIQLFADQGSDFTCLGILQSLAGTYSSLPVKKKKHRIRLREREKKSSVVTGLTSRKLTLFTGVPSNDGVVI